MVISKHEIQTFEVVIVVLLLLLLLFDVFVPTSAPPLFIFGQVFCPNVLQFHLQVLNVHLQKKAFTKSYY